MPLLNALSTGPPVEERYTRVSGLYPHKDLDPKKLRRLILDAKLAPCYPGLEEVLGNLEDCPICFLHYPYLNRSKCCKKGICTECYLQVRSPQSSRPAQCPFCKAPSYAVEFRGARSQEEKGQDRVEEQRVIEARIRARQEEAQAEIDHAAERAREQEERQARGEGTPQRASRATSSTFDTLYFYSQPERRRWPPIELPGSRQPLSVTGSPRPMRLPMSPSLRQLAAAYETRHAPFGQILWPDAELDLNLEDIMVMEAIWQSLQDHANNAHHASGSTQDASELVGLPAAAVSASWGSAGDSMGLDSDPSPHEAAITQVAQLMEGPLPHSSIDQSEIAEVGSASQQQQQARLLPVVASAGGVVVTPAPPTGSTAAA
eukprot:jgi/Chlat1/6776/Chrsp50S06464